jgi:hypothetical protein
MSRRDVNSAKGITRRLTFMTYNIHSGVAVDTVDLGRIRRVQIPERFSLTAAAA